MEDFLQKSPFENLHKGVKSKQNISLFSFLAIMTLSFFMYFDVLGENTSGKRACNFSMSFEISLRESFKKIPRKI